MTTLVHDVGGFREACAGARASGFRVALVPTMGSLHAGHLTLVREARKHANWVAASVFVNPTQFGPTEDFQRYPRDLENDHAKLEEAGAEVIFVPSVDAMYPADEQTRVRISSLTENLDGPHRPGHFDGVATVVAKLFLLAGPCVAIFGRKDYQQLKVITRMTRDLFFPVEVVGLPTVREPDGLAMSSRNTYLSTEERVKALSIVEGLRAAHELFESGERRVSALKKAALDPIEAVASSIDYVTIADPESLIPLAEDGPVIDRGLLAIAARIGKTRLIDNVVLGDDPWPAGSS